MKIMIAIEIKARPHGVDEAQVDVRMAHQMDAGPEHPIECMMLPTLHSLINGLFKAISVLTGMGSYKTTAMVTEGKSAQLRARGLFGPKEGG